MGQDLEKEKKSHGALIGSIIIILILLIGGIYIWQSKIKEVERLKTENQKLLQNEQSASIDTNKIQ